MRTNLILISLSCFTVFFFLYFEYSNIITALTIIVVRGKIKLNFFLNSCKFHIELIFIEWNVQLLKQESLTLHSRKLPRMLQWTRKVNTFFTVLITDWNWIMFIEFIWDLEVKSRDRKTCRWQFVQSYRQRKKKYLYLPN